MPHESSWAPKQRGCTSHLSALGTTQPSGCLWRTIANYCPVISRLHLAPQGSIMYSTIPDVSNPAFYSKRYPLSIQLACLATNSRKSTNLRPVTLRPRSTIEGSHPPQERRLGTAVSQLQPELDCGADSHRGRPGACGKKQRTTLWSRVKLIV